MNLFAIYNRFEIARNKLLRLEMIFHFTYHPALYRSVKTKFVNICLLKPHFVRISKSNYSTEGSEHSTKLDTKTIEHLEKLSLVNFEDKKYVAVVEKAIDFANNIEAIDTSNVEPLVSVLEDCCLRLRDDVVTEGSKKKEILQNASVIEEDYFVAPPGNIPIDFDQRKK